MFKLIAIVFVMLAASAYAQDNMGGGAATVPAASGWQGARKPDPFRFDVASDVGPSTGLIVGVSAGVAALMVGIWLATRKPRVRVAAAPTTKRCPDCAETVLAEAKVCRHCGFRWDGAAAIEPGPHAQGR